MKVNFKRKKSLSGFLFIIILFFIVGGIVVPSLIFDDASADSDGVELLWTKQNDASDPMTSTTGIIKTSDGGYIVTGQACEGAYSTSCINVAAFEKLNANGEREWIAKDNNGSGQYLSVVEVAVNDYVAVGYEYYGTHAYAIFSRFSVNNNVATKTEGWFYDARSDLSRVDDISQNIFGTVTLDDDGNFVIVGSSQIYQPRGSTSSRTVYVIKLDNEHTCTVNANLNVSSEKDNIICDEDIIYKVEGGQGTGWDRDIKYTIPKMIKTDNDTYVVSTGTTVREKTLMKVQEVDNTSAELIWEGGYYGNNYTGSIGVASAFDGEYALVTMYSSNRVSLLNYEELPNKKGVRGLQTVFKNGNYRVYNISGVTATDDGEYLIYGGVNSVDYYSKQSFLAKYDSSLNLIWEVVGTDIGTSYGDEYYFTSAVYNGDSSFTVVDNRGRVSRYQDNAIYHNVKYNIVEEASPLNDSTGVVITQCRPQSRTSAAIGTAFSGFEDYSKCMRGTQFDSNYDAIDFADYYAGYEFDGWYAKYENGVLSEKLTDEMLQAIQADTANNHNLYARYMKKSYEIPFFMATYDTADSEPEYTLVDTQTVTVDDPLIRPDVHPEGSGWQEADGWYEIVFDNGQITIKSSPKIEQDFGFWANAAVMKEKALENPDALVGYGDDATPIKTKDTYYDGFVVKFVRKTHTVNYDFVGKDCFPSGYIKSGSEAVPDGGTFNIGPVVTDNKRCYLTNIQSSPDGQDGWTDFNPTTPITDDIYIKGEWTKNYLVVKNDELRYADGAVFDVADADGIEYNSDTNTLALTNYLSSSCNPDAEGFLPIRIENGDDPVTVVFNGSNDLSGGGLQSTSPLILDGEGSLTTRNYCGGGDDAYITSASNIVVENGDYNLMGIIATGNLVVNNGKISSSMAQVEPNENTNMTNLVMYGGSFHPGSLSMNGVENNFVVQDGHVELGNGIRLDGGGNNSALNILIEGGNTAITNADDLLTTKSFIMNDGEFLALGPVEAEHLEINSGELRISAIYPSEPALTITGNAEFNGGKTTISGGTIPIFVEPKENTGDSPVSFTGGEIIIETLKDANAVINNLIDFQLDMMRKEMQAEMQEEKDNFAAKSDEEISQQCTNSLNDINQTLAMVGMEPYENSAACIEKIRSDFPDIMDAMMEMQIEYYSSMTEQQVEQMRPMIEQMMVEAVPVPIMVLTDDESAIYIAEDMERDAYDTKPENMGSENDGRKLLSVAKTTYTDLDGVVHNVITFGNSDGDVVITPKINEETGEQNGYMAENAPEVVHIYKKAPPVPDGDDDEEQGGTSDGDDKEQDGNKDEEKNEDANVPDTSGETDGKDKKDENKTNNDTDNNEKTGNFGIMNKEQSFVALSLAGTVIIAGIVSLGINRKRQKR